MEHLNHNGRVKYIVHGYMVKLQDMMKYKLPQQQLQDMEHVAEKLRFILEIRDISDDYPAILQALKVTSNIICKVDNDVRILIETSKGNVSAASNVNENDASNGNLNGASNGHVNDEAVANLPEIQLQQVNEHQDGNADFEVGLEEEDEEDLSDQSILTDESYASSDYFTETSGFVSDDTYEMIDSSLNSEYSEFDESFNL